jgi:hypothetical protein
LRYQRPQRKIEEVERNLGAVVGMIVIVLVARDRGKERKAGSKSVVNALRGATQIVVVAFHSRDQLSTARCDEVIRLMLDVNQN